MSSPIDEDDRAEAIFYDLFKTADGTYDAERDGALRTQVIQKIMTLGYSEADATGFVDEGIEDCEDAAEG